MKNLKIKLAFIVFCLTIFCIGCNSLASKDVEIMVAFDKEYQGVKVRNFSGDVKKIDEKNYVINSRCKDQVVSVSAPGYTNENVFVTSEMLIKSDFKYTTNIKLKENKQYFELSFNGNADEYDISGEGIATIEYQQNKAKVFFDKIENQDIVISKDNHAPYTFKVEEAFFVGAVFKKNIVLADKSKNEFLLYVINDTNSNNIQLSLTVDGAVYEYADKNFSLNFNTGTNFSNIIIDSSKNYILNENIVNCKNMSDEGIYYLTLLSSQLSRVDDRINSNLRIRSDDVLNNFSVTNINGARIKYGNYIKFNYDDRYIRVSNIAKKTSYDVFITDEIIKSGEIYLESKNESDKRFIYFYEDGKKLYSKEFDVTINSKKYTVKNGYVAVPQKSTTGTFIDYKINICQEEVPKYHLSDGLFFNTDFSLGYSKLYKITLTKVFNFKIKVLDKDGAYLPLMHENTQTHNDFLTLNNLESDKLFVSDLQFLNDQTYENYALPKAKIKIENCVKVSDENYELTINANQVGRNFIKITGINYKSYPRSISMKINNLMVRLLETEDDLIIIPTDVSLIGEPIKLVLVIRTSLFERETIYTSKNFTIKNLNDDIMTLKMEIDNYGYYGY